MKPDATRIGYNPDPDFTKSPLKISTDSSKRMLSRLRLLYGEKTARDYLPELERLIQVHHAYKPSSLIEAEKEFDPKERFTEKDMVLITYGDIIHGDEDSPLATLHNFIRAMNRGAVNTLHILPFFPYSSDRGFSVVDFSRVDPKLGTWEDLNSMSLDYDLMFDGVLNHCSSRSRMFQQFLCGNPYYKNFFISYDSPDDLTPDQRSKIFRPRTSDILSHYHTIEGPKYVWTTFSKDQIDLNFRNPEVLLRIIEALLFYVRQGADILRLDAVTFIWAEPGTECVHLPETHEIVKLFRDVMNVAAPYVALITETNVPHNENVSYFGNGYDQAHMVYNFALPPLVLHTFYQEDATKISEWARNLKPPSAITTFFNILDTHDGIGLMGAKGILSQTDIDHMIDRARDHGAYVSYKIKENHTEEPYEINSTWWSAINRDESDEDLDFQVKRYAATRSISLVLQGVPSVYAHGAIGTANDHELVHKTKIKRDVNRGIIEKQSVLEELNNPESKLSLLGRELPKLNLNRTSQRAFHPFGTQRVLMIKPEVFTLLRVSPEGDRHMLCMTNVTGRKCAVTVPLSEIDIHDRRWYDIVNNTEYVSRDMEISLTLEPYDVVWLKPFSEM